MNRRAVFPRSAWVGALYALVFLLATTLTPLQATTVHSGPPARIALISFGHNNAEEKNIKGQLQACGYAVDVLQIKSADDLEAKLISGNFDKNKSDTFMIILGHGSIKGGRGNFVFSDGEKDIMRGSVLAETLGKSFNRPHLWIDTCYAGDFKAGASIGGVGTSCRSEESWVKEGVPHPSTQVIVDLLCSARNDCKLFRQADQNRDGRIDPRELDFHLRQRLGETRDVKSTALFEGPVNTHQLLKQERSCVEQGLQQAVEKGHLYRLVYPEVKLKGYLVNVAGLPGLKEIFVPEGKDVAAALALQDYRYRAYADEVKFTRRWLEEAQKALLKGKKNTAELPWNNVPGGKESDTQEELRTKQLAYLQADVNMRRESFEMAEAAFPKVERINGDEVTRVQCYHPLPVTYPEKGPYPTDYAQHPDARTLVLHADRCAEAASPTSPGVGNRDHIPLPDGQRGRFWSAGALPPPLAPPPKSDPIDLRSIEKALQQSAEDRKLIQQAGKTPFSDNAQNQRLAERIRRLGVEGFHNAEQWTKAGGTLDADGFPFIPTGQPHPAVVAGHVYHIAGNGYWVYHYGRWVRWR